MYVRDKFGLICRVYVHDTSQLSVYVHYHLHLHNKFGLIVYFIEVVVHEDRKRPFQQLILLLYLNFVELLIPAAVLHATASSFAA